jgi:hypothetical protein
VSGVESIPSFYAGRSIIARLVRSWRQQPLHFYASWPETGLVRSSLACVLLLATGVSAFAPPTPIQIHLSTNLCSAPCTIVATVSIPKHPDNRLASMVWGYSDSEWTQWEPGSATDQGDFTMRIANLQKGNHRIYVVLLRQKDGEQQTFEDSQQVTVR